MAEQFPLLTDEQIVTLRWPCTAGLRKDFEIDAVVKFARAIEDATRAKLLAEIERLERERDAALAAQAQAEPYGWAVTGSGQLYFGEFAEHEAKDCARIVGGTAEAFPLYRHAAQPVRQPLTDERITQCWGESQGTRNGYVPFARAVERAHGIGQEGAQQ